MDGGGAGARDGDSALASLLLVHGMVMNGGVLHALEALDRGEVERGCAGFRYLGLAGAAEAIEWVQQQLASLGLDPDLEVEEEVEREGDDRYAQWVPDDSVLAERFGATFAADPGAFAPMR